MKDSNSLHLSTRVPCVPGNRVCPGHGYTWDWGMPGTRVRDPGISVTRVHPGKVFFALLSDIFPFS